MGYTGLFSSECLFQDVLLDSLTPHLLPTVPGRHSCAKQADGYWELAGYKSSCSIWKRYPEGRSEGVRRGGFEA